MLFLSQIKLVLAFAAVLAYVSSEESSISTEGNSNPTSEGIVNCATGKATVPPLVETDCQNALDDVPAISSGGSNYLQVNNITITKKFRSCQVVITTNNDGYIHLDKSKASLGLQKFFDTCATGAGNIVVPFGSTKVEGNSTASIFFDKPEK